MHERTPIPWRRAGELVLAICTAWLVLQNSVLLLLLAWRPLTAVGLAAVVLLRVAIHAAAPVTITPGSGLLGVACALPWAALAVLGVRHG